MRCSLTLGETNLDHAKNEASPMLRNRQDESGAMPTFGRVICDTHRTRATLRIRDFYGPAYTIRRVWTSTLKVLAF